MTARFDLAAYFRRIGFAGVAAPDLATLSALHRLHVSAIPFENLDPLMGRPVPLDLEALQDKLIGRRRGGYCFEQNAVFRATLETIGFAVTPLSARVRWMSGADAPMTPRTHMLLKVDLAEGAYIADVGFGAHLQDAPLRLDTGSEQRTPAGVYRLRDVDGMLALEMLHDGAWRTGFLFNLEATHEADYRMANWYTSTSPWSPFPNSLIVERVAGGVRYNLVNRILAERQHGAGAIEYPIATARELGEILEGVFHLDPPASPEDIWARTQAE